MSVKFAAATYAANMAETRAHFAAERAALRRRYDAGLISVLQFDSSDAGIKAQLAYFTARERELFFLNRDHPLEQAA